MPAALRPIPLATSQHRKSVLTVTPSLNGYRLAFVGGAAFDVIEEAPSLEGAIAAQQAAQRSLSDLNRIFNTKGA